MRYSILFFYIIGLFSLMVLVHESVHLIYHKEVDDKRICLFSEGKIAYTDLGDIVPYNKVGEPSIEKQQATLAGWIVGLVGCVFLAKNKEAIKDGK